MSAGVTCPACGVATKRGRRFCTQCGAFLPSERSTPEAATSRPLGQGLLFHSRYRVDRVLGRGGMGAVYLVRDELLADRPCAMKELIDHAQSGHGGRTLIDRFTAEARTLASLNHPGIPQVYDRFSEQGRHYLVMEFVAGMDLGRLLETHMRAHGAPLSEAAVVHWAYRISDVLAYLHAHDPPVVHRDLKPANLIPSPGGYIKVVDFGIARVATERIGTGIGTLGYAPPEQYRGETEPRSDLFALGASMHHLLTGRDPQLQAPFDFPPVHVLVPTVSLGLGQLIAHLLAATPHDRPQSAKAVQEALASNYPDRDLRTDPPEGGITALLRGQFPLEVGDALGGASAGAQSPSTGPPCAICGHAGRPGGTYCTNCGVHRLGSLRPIRTNGVSITLPLRVPPRHWEAGRVERLGLLPPRGDMQPVLAVARLTGEKGQYMYVVPGVVGPAAGKAVEAFRLTHSSEGEALAALTINEPERVAEAVDLWCQRFGPVGASDRKEETV